MLASIFIREAIYASFRKAGLEKGLIAYFANLLIPSIGDDIFTYNLKWFVSGLLSGVLMSIWIPLIIYGSSILGVYLVTLFLVAYMVMMMLISILIITDLIHQVIASINELALWKRIEYLPISMKSIEKAASYSVLIGGGVSLLFGMGLSIGLIIYAFTDLVSAVAMIPLGFTASTLLVYPIMVYLYSKFSGRAPPLISLVIHVAIVVTILSIYLNTLSFQSVNEVMEFLQSYRLIFPFPYVYIAINGYEPIAFSASITYFATGLLLSMFIPSKYGIRLINPRISEHGKARIFNLPRLLTASLKDIVLLLRDATRQKQFYGQLAALSTPFVITLLSNQVVTIMHGMEFIRSLVLVSFFGFLSYIMAAIATPVLVFMEADRNMILYALPLSKEETIIAKTIASTILYQPLPIILFILTSIIISPIHGFVIYLTSTMFWIMGAYLSYKLVLHLLWGSLGAWTEFSLGILKRLGVILALIIPMGIFLIITLVLYIYLPLNALILLLITPTPLTIYVFTKALRE